MKFVAVLFMLFAGTAKAPAENEAKPVAPTAPSPLIYELRDLKPAGITQYASGMDTVRQYLQFQNAQGNHHVIYEEVPSLPPARTVVGLRQMASAFDSLCSMDIECSSKAFCTGDCRSMYYETSNAPADPVNPDRSKCKILFFSCEKATTPSVAAPAPVPGT